MCNCQYLSFGRLRGRIRSLSWLFEHCRNQISLQPSIGEPPLRKYYQLWSQFVLKDGIVWRCYAPGPTAGRVTVPVLPAALQKDAHHKCRDSPQAGQQGSQKTGWDKVNMAKDEERHCKECTVCQQTNKVCHAPTRAQMMNVPIGRPWQMIVIDILEVPVSSNNNWYLLPRSLGLLHQMGWDLTATRIPTEL